MQGGECSAKFGKNALDPYRNRTVKCKKWQKCARPIRKPESVVQKVAKMNETHTETGG